MIDSRIKIGDGAVKSAFAEFGFIYISSDHRVGAPEKQRDTTTYAGDPVEHTDTRAVLAPFDYTVKFAVNCENNGIENANKKIAAFNNAIRENTAQVGVKRCREVVFYDDFHKTVICGIPEPIAEASEFYRMRDGSIRDCVVFDLKIRVNDPTKCVFST